MSLSIEEIVRAMRFLALESLELDLIFFQCFNKTLQSQRGSLYIAHLCTLLLRKRKSWSLSNFVPDRLEKES